MQLGFPTANIAFPDTTASGIYAARVFVGEVEYTAAVFIDPSRKILEVHVLDFAGDLYGQEMRVELLHKIRDSMRFDSDETLKAAIARDVKAVREYFTERTMAA